MPVAFTVNGRGVSADVDPDTPLLWVLRDTLGLTGTKYGCGIAQCGACTVHVNGMTRRSCVTPVRMVDGGSVTTIEGLDGPIAAAVQTAWRELDVPQCGFCQSGQIMSAVALLTEKVKPTREDVEKGMAGNVCRCATYVRIRNAVHRAAEALET